MTDSLQSLIQTGTKLWLDSIDPQLVEVNLKQGATGATSNPVIIADLIKTGRFDGQLEQLIAQGLDDHEVAWQITDQLVQSAQQAFLPIWERTGGDDGYVSFELDPLLEDPARDLSHQERVEQYVRLGRKWSAGHQNRLIKVPATAAGLDALEELAASGVPLNVTLIFTERQYLAARDGVWRGAQRLASRDKFKSVYSIFVSRLDVYAEQHLGHLSEAAREQLGIVNAKRIWADNQKSWAQHDTPLSQEIVFASTGVKTAGWPAWKYVEAFAGSDIQTNPPATNEAVASSGLQFARRVDQPDPAEVCAEIDKVDFQELERVLMEEGIAKFANPQKDLLALIGRKREELAVEG